MNASHHDVRCYFSFRSPYAWLALLQLERVSTELGLRIELVPVYPPADFPNDPTRVPNKMKHMFEDVTRLTRALGVELRWPRAADIGSWTPSHAAFLAAEREGRGLAFAQAVFRARFSEGKDVSDEGVLREAARRAEVAEECVIAGTQDPDLLQRAEVFARDAFAHEGIFGVPAFRFGDQLFWGQDRLPWLIRAVKQKRGEPVPDLARNPFGPVC